ncbi:MAG TPA: hypothetical protein VES93_06970 [Ornithinibacter sp.]|nr:hypothetical protein [Ornithinibacter sp.]
MAPPRRALTAVLVVLALAAAGVLAVGTLGYCSVFGCTFFSEDFDPHGERATSARADATAGVAALADRVSLGYEVLAVGTVDGCVEGQHNWKRKDVYSHECSVVDSRVLLATRDPAAVADGLTAMDAVLRGLGCAPTPAGGLDRVRDEYWRDDNPQVQRRGAAGLPSAWYTCSDGRTVLAKPTSDAEPSTDPEAAFGSRSPGDEISGSWYTAADVSALTASGAQLALVMRVEQTYYRTRF